MTGTTTDLLHRSLLFFFVLFVVASTFSIALSQTALGVSLVLFIVICIKDRFQPFVSQLKWVWLFIGLYVFWLLLSCLLGATPLRSVLIAKEEWLFLAMPITVYLARDDRTRRLLVTAFAFGVGLISLYGILQAFTGMAWLKLVDGRFVNVPILDVQGNFNNCMTFGNFCVTAGCFLLGLGLSSDNQSGWRRRLYVVAGFLAIVTTALTLRRGAIAAAVVTLALLAVLHRSKKRWLLVALSAAIVATIVAAPGLQWRFGEKAVKDLNTTNPSSRVYIWTRSLDIVKHHSVFGVGQGNFYDEYVSRLPADIPPERKLTHAHNDFINVAAIAGIPGALFFAGIWLAVLHLMWHAYRNERFSPNGRAFCLAAFLGAVAFLITSLIEATFADEEVRQMLMFVWAIGLATVYKESERPTQTA